MAFDTLQVEVLESLLSFSNAIGHRSVGGALSTFRWRKREIGEREMNNLKRYQQPHVTKLTFYSFGNLLIYIANYFQLNNLKLGRNHFELQRNDF